jgi:protein SCO1/2
MPTPTPPHPHRLRFPFPLLLGLVAACRPSAPPAPTAIPGARTATSASEVRSYRLVGVVRSVDHKEGEVVIHHEAIPGYMRAMTMSFPVEDKAILDDLRPGDGVEGTLRVGKDRSDLVSLDVTRPAPAAPLTLDVKGGVAHLNPTPQLLEPGQEVPDFTVTTEDGKTLRLSDLRGKLVMLTFIYTRCPLPDFCPLMDRRFAALADKIGAVPGRSEQVRLLSVSFDPEHDTPAVLARHARNQGARAPLWTYAVASHEELQKVAASLGLAYAPGSDEIAHNLSTSLIDGHGRLVRLEKGRKWDLGDFLKLIYARLPASRH